MYAAASVSSGQGFHFSRRYQIEIAFDRVFQGRGGSCEFDGLCRSGCQQSVDNAGGKSVSAVTGAVSRQQIRQMVGD